MTYSWSELLAMAWVVCTWQSRYAVEHLRGSLRLLVILGHSGCGAISAAVDTFLEPAGYLALATNHAIRGILDRQLIVI